MRVGGGHPMPIDQWYTVDKLVNGTVDTSKAPVTGGHCRNVKKGSYSYTQNGIEKSGSFDRCMDDCDIFGGTVVNTEHSGADGSKSTTPTCQLTEATCMSAWWHADTSTCDLGCSNSGGKLQPVDANLPNGEKTCSWNDTTDKCIETYKYTPSWSNGTELCDNFCQTNSGTLTPEGACVYSNMTY